MFPYQQPHCRCFRGKCVVLLQSDEEKGKGTLTVQGTKLVEKKLTSTLLFGFLVFTYIFLVGIAYFINFYSANRLLDNVKALTGYMICAAAVSVLYPGAMLFLGLRNRWLYEQLQRKAEGEREALESFPPHPLKGKIYRRILFAHKVVPTDLPMLVSALNSDQKLTEEEKDSLIKYIKEK